MEQEQKTKADAPYLSEEVLDLLDLVSQIRGSYGGHAGQEVVVVAAVLLLVKQIRFLRDDLANK